MKREPCSHCDGKGYVERCELCGGTGYVLDREAVRKEYEENLKRPPHLRSLTIGPYKPCSRGCWPSVSRMRPLLMEISRRG